MDAVSEKFAEIPCKPIMNNNNNNIFSGGFRGSFGIEGSSNNPVL